MADKLKKGEVYKHKDKCGCFRCTGIAWNKGMACGMHQNAFYRVWTNMKTRCMNSYYVDFNRYGGRGIKICKEWLSFRGFYKDMYKTYKKNLTLDRINNNGNYEASNCRWASRKIQAENRIDTHLFKYKGIADTLMNWANYFGIKRSTLAMRIYVYKWEFGRAIHTPVRERRYLGQH